WISSTGSTKASGALLLLDIDQFKLVCDTYGHGMGDEFLRRVARMLQITMRYVNSQYFNDEERFNIIARLSGDEFIVFIPMVDRAGAIAAAEQIRKGLEGFYHADAACHLTVSMGISLYPEHGSATTELLTKADAAMYRAKDLGRNRFHVYNPEDRAIELMRSRLVWKENILDALKDDKFEPWYQPIKSLKMDKVMHYEVLARMKGADGGIILPGPFIDIAERFGLVGQISKVVIEKAMRFLKRLNMRGQSPAFCMNVSGKQLGDSEFLWFLQSKIDEVGLDPGRVIFEITETSSIGEIDKAVRFLKSLKNKGCHIALDDFGIGFTSFMYLKELDVDYIKIAGPFIKNLDKNLNDRLFVKAIVDVAKGMNIQTIAEFVEREETVSLLRDIGIDYAQGYFIGKPSSVITA
ncbi:MAG: bifunctional diguanylate cyclase/phosphodiesterase, partial [Deltaproteobacteria bacterium]|nr:bifunctional diguanylate cyclase/phosphodiesterase [Deltaproteobacteria bacterium]